MLLQMRRWGYGVAGVSLGAPAELRFMPNGGGTPIKVLVPRRSICKTLHHTVSMHRLCSNSWQHSLKHVNTCNLLFRPADIMTQEARTMYKHGVFNVGVH
jgi:hypothetical protein